MKKIYHAALIAVLTSTSFFASAGENFPGSHNGINIVSREEMLRYGPPWETEQHAKKIKSIKKNGYILTHNIDQIVNGMKRAKKDGPQQIRDYDDSSDPYYRTYIKSSPEKVGIAFNFQGVPGINQEKVIGYAAGSSYIEGRGWDGIVEFFEDSKLGICRYNVLSFKKIFLPEDQVKYVVNKKISDYAIFGNSDVGFLYNVSWFDQKPTRAHKLQCTNTVYAPHLITELIKLAEKTDKVFELLNPPEE